eukprot:scpid98474/ scgid4495/ 
MDSSHSPHVAFAVLLLMSVLSGSHSASCSDPAPCNSRGTCTEVSGLYNSIECTCYLGYTGDTCEFTTDSTTCTSSTCSDHGYCSYEFGMATCSCYSGYTGDLCESLTDTSTSCTSSYCNFNGACSSEFGPRTCSCYTGYTGDFCATYSRPCTSNDYCNFNGDCSYNSMGDQTCACYSGYSGDQCAYNGYVSSDACTPGYC